MRIYPKPLKKLHRKVRRLTTNPQTTLVLFDHFGVVGIDPLIAWQKYHHLSATNRRQVQAVCQQIDAGKISLTLFYRRLGKIVNQTGPATQVQIASMAGYNQELLTIIKQLTKNKHLRLGLLSNAHRSLHQDLWHDGVHQLFDDVLTSQEISQVKPKPDPEFFLHAINRLGGQPQNTIFFDDRPLNVTAAKHLSIKAHLFTTAQQCRVDLLKHKAFQ